MRLALPLLTAALVGTGGLLLAAEPNDNEGLLARGEALLASGEIAGAEAVLERGAALGHAPEIEVSLVRAYMEAGQYRRALAFAAHAAGAHAEYPRAAALYAWLLHAGGQQAVAVRTLQAVPAVVANDELVLQVRERLQSPLPIADGVLLEPPARFAPYPSLALDAAVVASAVLIDGGGRALTTATALADGDEVWVRNGRGDTVRAYHERTFEVGGLAVASLRLATSLAVPADIGAAARMPFAGSVLYAVEYSPSAVHAEPAWPLVRLGFLGRATQPGEPPLLDVALPPGFHGGPIFDEAGRLAGLAAPGQDGRNRLVASAMLPAEIGSLGTPSVAGPTPRIALDLLYERSMLSTLQLIVARRGELAPR